MEEAYREIGWNIQYYWLIYPLLLIPLCIFFYGVYSHYQLIKIGAPLKDNRLDNIGKRFLGVITFSIFQQKILRDKLAGIMHLIIFWGFAVLFIVGALMDAVEEHIANHIFHTSYLHGPIYLYHSLLLDIFGFLAILGIILALIRRYLIRPDKLDNKVEDAVILWGILVILVTGFHIEGARIAVDELKHNPQWAIWSPVGLVIAKLLLSTGMTDQSLVIFHKGIWWFHMFLAFGGIAYIPYSKLVHILFYPTNQFLRKLDKPAEIMPIPNIEEAEQFGVCKVEEFTWKQIFDVDSCNRCGRCQEVCPAYLTEKPLSPKEVTQNIKGHWLVVGPTILKEKRKKALESETKPTEEEHPDTPALIGDVIKEDTLWSCTTCRSCEEQCLVFVEHVSKIIDMRRNLVLMESKFPQEVNLVFRNMEKNSNPWGIGAHTRLNWAEGLEVKKLDEGVEAEYLYYVGCAGSFDDRNKKISQSVVKILKSANIDFAVLGESEGCCGDSARRIGNEYLFKILAETNIEVFNTYKVKKIITQCPHCYNILKNEYPQLGANFEVYHHTEFIEKLLREGSLKISNLQASVSNLRCTYHDSCYLGRYNQIYDEPRNIIANLGVKIVEMKRNRSRSFCCGAGGGRMWMEERIGKRINEERLNQALQISPELIVTACPFCLTMFEDGLKTKEMEEKIKVMDLAEIIANSM